MYSDGKFSALCRSKRGLMVFLCGLMVSLIAITYIHNHKLTIPKIGRNQQGSLMSPTRVHNTRIDPESVVLKPLSPKKDNRLHNVPTTVRPQVDVSLIKKPTPPRDNIIQNKSEAKQDVATHNSDKKPSVKKLIDMIPRPRAQNANCEKLFNNDADEIKRVFDREEEQTKVPVPDEEYSKLTNDCEFFKKSRSYITQPLSQEEKEFPLAYSIMMFKDVEQFERLLRAIYMPQNYYCIHVDVKAAPEIQKSVAAIAKCFDNVILASRQVDVNWAYYSVLEADLICMEDLYKKFTKWKYFINLTGQEFPLKTNRELVKILKVFNGAVNMEGTIKRRNLERTMMVHEGINPVEPRIDKAPVPHNIQLTKGSVHIAAPREFAEFVLYNTVAKDFREWVKDTGVPDETFFSSLGHNPQLGVPGAYKGEPETDEKKYPFLVRYKNWGGWPFDYPCYGKRVRAVCIASVGDLYIIKDRPELFINKFHIDYSPSALDCTEQRHFQRIRDELLGLRNIDLKFYEKFDFVRNHV